MSGRHTMPGRRAGIMLLTLLATGAQAATLDALGRQLTFTTADGSRWARLSGMTDLTLLAAEQPPPGLLFSDDDVIVAPRLSLSADAGLGERLSGHVQARIDRGLDPLTKSDGDVRLDQYFLQVDMTAAARARLRVGKFATAFGGWVERHLAWDNPLITAPAVYDDLVAVTAPAAPPDPADFAGRRDAAENKDTWVPIVWGPSYATGASLAAGAGDFDLVLEVKNSSLSSQPAVWDDGFDTDPTYTGRLSWRPRPEWTVAASHSRGPYLLERAQPTLPPGADVDDFDQTTTGLDVTYERHRLQIWAELVRSSFDVPRVGEVDVTSGFVELRYKPAPGWWLAGRWNGSRFDHAPGTRRSWDRHLTRLDLAVGYRHTAHLQAKLEYSIGEQAGTDTNGNHVVAAQLVLWF